MTLSQIVTGILIGLLCFSIQAMPQDAGDKTFKVPLALPSETVYDIQRDHRGCLWFSTLNGLCSYDGRMLRVYTGEDGLPDNEIFFTVEDRYKRNWISTYNGEISFIRNGRIYSALTNIFLKGYHHHPHIKFISTEYDGSITIVLNMFERIINISLNDFRVINLPDRIKYNPSGLIFLKKTDNAQWKIFYSDHTEIFTTSYPANSSAARRYINNERYRYTVSDNKHYLYNDHIICDLDEKPLTRFSKPLYNEREVIRIYHDDKHVFVCTRSGFIADSIPLLDGIFTTSVVADINGLYWISTMNNGIYCLNTDHITPSTDTFSQAFDWGSTDGIKTYLDSKKAGLFKFDEQTKQASAILKRGDWHEDFLASYISGRNRYYGFHHDRFIIKDFYSGKIVLKSYEFSGISYIKKIVSSGGRIYLFLPNAYCSIEEEGDGGSDINDMPADDISFWERRTKIFAVDRHSSGDIYFSTSDSLYKIPSGEKHAIALKNNISYRSFVCFDSFILGITYAGRNVIYPLTSYPAYPFAVDGRAFWKYIIPLDAATALIATDKVVKVFSAASKKGYVLYNLAGKYHLPDKDPVYYKNNGNIFIHRGNIRYKFAIKEIVSDTLQSITKLHITNVNARYVEYDVDEHFIHDNDKPLRIGVQVIDFADQVEKYWYSFNMQGSRYAWRSTKDAEIHFDNLLPGKYIFTVAADTSDRKEAKSLLIEVRQPFTQSYLFLIIIGVALLAIVLFVVYRVSRKQISRIVREKNRQLQLQQLEFRALNALMNPHFIFNCLGSIQSLINRDERKEANRYLNMFSMLIRQNMSFINADKIRLSDELEFVEQYLKLEQLRFKERITYSFNIDPSVDPNNVFLPPISVQPLVENAVIHGLKEPMAPLHVTVHVHRNGGQMVVIDVVDNGRGFTPDVISETGIKGMGIALQSLNARLANFYNVTGCKASFNITSLNNEQTGITGVRASIIITAAS